MTQINRFLFIISYWGLLLIPFKISGQQNLIRNHSFESGRGSPHGVDQFTKCRKWKNYATLYNGGAGTSDWFKATPRAFQGTVSCRIAGNSTLNIWPFVPTDDGIHYAGIVKWEYQYQGEGIQQKLRNKLAAGFYHLEFDYLIPCDTMNYALEVYLGAGESHLTHLGAAISIPSTNIGQWQTVSRQVQVSNALDGILDWFIVLNTSQYNYNNGTVAHEPYIYLDNFRFTKNPCTTCDPTGLISWNDNSMRPYLTPNNDGVFDQWCMTNINYASWYEFEVFDRWGGTVYSENASDPNGYENLALCWDGRNNQSQMLNVPNEYQIRVRLGNCGTQTTNLFQVYTSNDLAHDTFSVAQNYVPPLFGLNTPPTHFKQLHLYGGPYYGTHDWYACETIWLDDAGAPRVPYFRAASTSDLGFYATDGIFIDHADVDFVAGSDIDINPQHVQCCPPFRLQNPDLQSGPIGNLDTLIELELPIEPEANNTKQNATNSQEFKLEVFPSPAKDVLKINFYLPQQIKTSISLVDAAGISVFELLDSALLETGNHAYSVSVKSLPTGVYVLRFRMGEELILRKVVIQH